MKIFIAGARSITKLDDDARNRILSICEKGYDILVGDCYGVDTAVQSVCAGIGYKNAVVYASNGCPRNNVGNWSVKSVQASGIHKSFEFYRQKDIAMSNDADCGYMIWDGESRGTLNNIVSLVSQNKLVVVYIAPYRKNLKIQTRQELDALIDKCPRKTKALYSGIVSSSSDDQQTSVFS